MADTIKFLTDLMEYKFQNPTHFKDPRMLNLYLNTFMNIDQPMDEKLMMLDKAINVIKESNRKNMYKARHARL